MRKSMKILAVASALVAGVAIGPALSAHDSERAGGSIVGSGMMDQGGMMGMMNMMGQMSQMMDRCNAMMQGAGDGGASKPNEQWRENAPAAPGNNG